MIVANAEKAAERYDGVGYPAAALLDHQALDAADLVAVGVEHGGALYLVTADQADGFVFGGHEVSPCANARVENLWSLQSFRPSRH